MPLPECRTYCPKHGLHAGLDAGLRALVRDFYV